MGIKIVTGKRPENHITSEDDRYRHAAVFGRYASLLDVGEHLAPSIISATSIRIASGDMTLGGVHARIPFGEYEDVDIQSGTTGYNRMDAIVIAYSRTGGYEDVSIEVVQGEPTTGTPSLNTAELISLYGNPPTNPDGSQITSNDSTDFPTYGDPMTMDRGAAVIAVVKLVGVNIEIVNPRASQHNVADDLYNLTNIGKRLAAYQQLVSQFINNLQAQISGNDTDIANLSVSLQSLATKEAGDVQSLLTKIDSVQSDVNSKYNELAGSINTVDTTLTQAIHQVASTESSHFTTIETQIEALSQRVKKLEG